MNKYRTHYSGEITEKNIGEEVILSGWVDTIRDLGGVKFLDIRDESGITQVTISENEKIEEIVKGISLESTITVAGMVRKRAEETINPLLKTGRVELLPTSIEVHGKCKNMLPFEIGAKNVRDDLRLEYRFLDLRSSKTHENILFRARTIKTLREKMEEQAFVEIQTPILANSSPEGARDFLVPSRLNPGKFYALPQAPQQFKQLLMLSGFDKYYQIAPCFRDEDSRADRSPGEFYQLDLEMSFATQEDVFATMEKVTEETFKSLTDWKVTSAPYERIKYEDAMLKYGSDKPDLRNPLIIHDISEVFVGSEFNAFADKTVRVINAEGACSKSRSFFDDMTAYAVNECKAKGLAWVKVNDDMTISGPIAKFISKAGLDIIFKKTGAKPNDAMFFIAEKKSIAEKLSGLIRNELGKRLELIHEGEYKFCWIVDFPMYEKGDNGKIDFSHNPFSMPQGNLKVLKEQKPLEIKAYQYDLVCNGYELGSGAVRNHDPEIMIRAFEIAGYTEDDVMNRFPALFKAFHYGAPPHAGIAVGVERIVMLLRKETNIREVIAFPKNSKAQDLLMNAPSEVTQDQLRDICIKIDKNIIS